MTVTTAPLIRVLHKSKISSTFAVPYITESGELNRKHRPCAVFLYPYAI